MSLQTFLTTPKKYSPRDPRQQQITDHLVMFIACDMIPFSVTESIHFKKLMESADSRYQVPSRKHLDNKLLMEKCRFLQSAVKSDMESAMNICVTLDIWSSRQMKSFLGITAYYNTDWTFKSVVLACKRFRGRHTADKIIRQGEACLEEFGIARKISIIVTDNASNMTAAFSLPGYEIEDEKDDEHGFDDMHDTEELDVEEIIPGEHMPCLAHTVQLVVKDELKKAGHLNKAMQKASRLVSFARRSTIAADVLDGEKRLPSGCPTRWNSQVIMISSVLCISEEKLSKVDGAPPLDTFDRNVLQDVVSLLQPFVEITDTAQLQNSVSSSLMIPSIKELRHKLKNTTSRYNNALKAALLESIDKRLRKFEENDNLRLASALDPR